VQVHSEGCGDRKEVEVQLLMRIREGRKLRAESSVIRREVDARVIRGSFENNGNMLDVMKINGVWAVTTK
jgi:acyl-coenzyme A thioesterase PaaI-like protein